MATTETALEQAHFHWGRAEAFRSVTEHITQEAEAGK